MRTYIERANDIEISIAAIYDMLGDLFTDLPSKEEGGEEYFVDELAMTRGMLLKSVGGLLQEAHRGASLLLHLETALSKMPDGDETTKKVNTFCAAIAALMMDSRDAPAKRKRK